MKQPLKEVSQKGENYCPVKKENATVNLPVKPQVHSYYFPNWHPDARNEVFHGKGWTEWEVTKCARPRFPGHKQPKVPLWGYEDESNPLVMAKKIQAASDYGIDGFIFDWYWFEDGPYRIRCLDEGFLGAPNNESLKFSVMWANHNAIQTHPGSRMFRRPTLIPGIFSVACFERATEHCIKHYFNRPNYTRIDGGLLFIIYQLRTLIEGFGGIEITKAALHDFRLRTREAGLGELNLCTITEGSTAEELSAYNELLLELGINSCTAYNATRYWETFPFNDYLRMLPKQMDDLKIRTKVYSIPYYATVTMGWDVSPRSVQSEVYEDIGYPFTPIIVNNTPENYEKALRTVADFMGSGQASGNMITLNCWNEWTEGSYLEPDTEYGMAYLEAVRRVFCR